MKKFWRWYLAVFALLICSSVLQYGCADINLSKRSKHSLLPETTVSEQTSVAVPSNKTIDLNGQWAMGFKLRGSNTSTAGTMLLRQNGNNFAGNGKDSENGPSYKIERGTLRGNDIMFLKRYENDPNPAVQYHGQFSYLSGDSGPVPYMGGDFSRETKGVVVTGEWEAMQNPPPKVEAVKEPVPVSSPAAPEPVAIYRFSSDHVPDLSGKWQMAFEYNFKVVHAIVFLEQDGKKLSGHGVEQSTGNHFLIKKGWYSYPRAGFIYEYISSNKTKHAPPIHEMTFKADVSVVNEKDYQGPYLSGKTQGGGGWEAERVN